MFSNIDEALEWVMNRRRKHSPFKHFKEVLNNINNPQNNFYMIHVGGTNGKGSTVTFLRDLLISQGFKVGTLQSPHYETHLDRIRLNGNNISEEAFIRLLNKNYDLIIKEELSMFEIDYLIMCDYFKENNIDIAIVEVGLGGRLDSTNVVDNTKLSIITTIGYDHTETLGDTLEEICLEKCGIIKKDSKVLVGKLEDNLKEIVKEKCKENNSKYYELKDYLEKENRTFIYNNEEYQIQSFAKYQMHNASLALEAFDIISKDYPFEVDLNKAKKALASSLWKGRFELVHTSPNIFLDGAHNIHGISALVKSINDLKGSKLIIFSALKKKRYLEMLEELNKLEARLVITTFDFPGSIKEENIKDYNYEFINDYESFIKNNLNNYDNIIICGSLYFLSEIVNKDIFKKK